MPEMLPDWSPPALLRLRLELSRLWYMAVAVGMLALPLSVEAGLWPAGLAGFGLAVAGAAHIPRSLLSAAYRVASGPLRPVALLIGLQALLSLLSDFLSLLAGVPA